MKYIEDYVAHFATYTIRFSNFDEKIAQSLGMQCFEGKAFTAKQADIAIRLLKKYKSQFVAQGFTDLPNILENPTYKFSFRVVDQQKLVFVDHAQKKFMLKFPFDQNLVTELRSLNAKKGMFKAEWDQDQKQWTLDLNEESLKFIIEKLSERNFEITDEIRNFSEKYQEITENFENYIPMLVKENGQYIFKNIKTDFSSNELYPALVQAAKLAVSVYDDEVSEEITKLTEENPLARVFAEHEKQNFNVSKNKFSRNQLVNFAKSFDTGVAIFLDESATADTLKMWVDSLISCGISLDEVGVFCRQKNDTNGIAFNTVIKENGLNKSVSDNVTWMFLMTKYPKSLVKVDKMPEICIFDNKYINAHHTVKSVVKNSMLNFLHNEFSSRGDEFVVL